MTLKFRIILTLSEITIQQAPRAKLGLSGHNGKIFAYRRSVLRCITVTENTRWAEICNALIKGAQRRFYGRRHTWVID